MRSRRSSQEHVAEVARRRLELLSAELAAIRPDPVDPPVPGERGGSGEPFEPLPPTQPADPARPPLDRPAEAGPGRHAHRPVGVAASVAGWAQDRLPPTVQGRVRLTGAHLAVVVAVVVAGVALTAWWVARADGGATALPPVPATPAGASGPSVPVTPGVASGTGGPAAASPSAGAAAAAGPATTGSPGSPGSQIVVDVTGKVHRPGIARLPQGSRVVDALQAAGGPRRGVSLASLNLARVLADGEQVVVGVRAPPGVAASAAGGTGVGTAAGGAATPGAMVNINTADQAALESLPGVGPVTARSILDYRTEKGGFTSVDELLEVSGIGDATLAKISPYCTL